MIKFKNRKDLTYSSFLICLVEDCQEEALKLWPTETNILDVCDPHFKQLQMEENKL